MKRIKRLSLAGKHVMDLNVKEKSCFYKKFFLITDSVDLPYFL